MNVLEGMATIANNRYQTLAVFGSHDHTYILRHGTEPDGLTPRDSYVCVSVLANLNVDPTCGTQ